MAPRALLGSSTSDSGVSTTAILLIVFVAILPVLIAIGVVVWALCFYGRDGCCGARKKTKTKHSQEKGTSHSSLERRINTENKLKKPARSYSIPGPVKESVLARYDSLLRKQSSEKSEQDDGIAPQSPKRFV